MAIFSEIYNDYTVTVNVDAVGVPQLLIEYDNAHNTGILDGKDELNDIEILQFSDGERVNKDDILLLTGVENG